MGRSDLPTNSKPSRLQRLAAHIEALEEKDCAAMKHEREIGAMRRSAAVSLHRICAEFVASLNSLLPRSEVLLDPPEYPLEQFQEHLPSLIQMSVRGRILQVGFKATCDLASTEDFRIPYTLAGSVRAFNQELLDKDLIEEQLLFFTLEKPVNMWRFFDARTYRSGPFDQAYLVSLMEQII